MSRHGTLIDGNRSNDPLVQVSLKTKIEEALNTNSVLLVSEEKIDGDTYN